MPTKGSSYSQRATPPSNSFVVCQEQWCRGLHFNILPALEVPWKSFTPTCKFLQVRNDTVLLSGLEPDKHLFPKKLALMHVFSCSTSKISLCLCKHQDQKKKKKKIIHVMLGFFFHCTWICSDCFPSHFEHLCWFVLLQLPPSTVAVYMASFLLFRGREATAEERLGSYTGSPSLLTASLFKVFRSIHPTSYVTPHRHFTVSITKLFMELQRK